MKDKFNFEKKKKHIPFINSLSIVLKLIKSLARYEYNFEFLNIFLIKLL